MAKAPIDRIPAGPIVLSIWENEFTKGKETIVTQSVSIQKNYKTKDGKWESTSSFKHSDLPFVVMAIEEALRRKYIKESTKNTVDEVSFDE